MEIVILLARFTPVATCESRAHLRARLCLTYPPYGAFHALMIMTRNLDEGQTGFTLGILKRAGDLLPPLRACCAHVLIRCIPGEAYTRVSGPEVHRGTAEIPSSTRAAINSLLRLHGIGNLLIPRSRFDFHCRCFLYGRGCVRKGKTNCVMLYTISISRSNVSNIYPFHASYTGCSFILIFENVAKDFIVRFTTNSFETISSFYVIRSRRLRRD